MDLDLGGIFTIWYLNYQYFSKEKVKHMGGTVEMELFVHVDK